MVSLRPTIPHCSDTFISAVIVHINITPVVFYPEVGFPQYVNIYFLLALDDVHVVDLFYYADCDIPSCADLRRHYIVRHVQLQRHTVCRYDLSRICHGGLDMFIFDANL